MNVQPERSTTTWSSRSAPSSACSSSGQVDESFAVDSDNRRAAVARGLDLHLDVAWPCHERECRRRCSVQADMTDRISPHRSLADYRMQVSRPSSSAGSVAAWSCRTSEWTDLQLAVLSVLEARGDDEVTVEVEAAEERVSVSVGPLVEGGSDQALARVLDPLVDSVEPVRRDGREWLMLQLER